MKLVTSKKGLLTAGLAAPAVLRHSLGLHRTCDTSFTFRMGAGFAGDVNRGHPASILPCLIDVNAPPTAYGQPVVVDATTQGVRPLVAGDSALTSVYGVTVRPFPMQHSTTSNFSGAAGYGSITPPTVQPIDVIRAGYVLVSVVGAPLKGGTVYIWIATSSGNHVQGGFEAASGGGSTITLSGNYTWNSPNDGSTAAGGIAELSILL